ncbi:MAG: FxsA family protein [Proteobacteria bacterium]|jgi:UPF0716 protein FxsA|nr:FxsA family protein [Pseudomonadota bacterium]MDA1301233.1 FxsA family protein [Pseudomonadota bacterium]
MRIALAIFIIVPIVEMLILIEVGGMIGALPTVALVVLTATVGIWLLRRQGIATLHRVQQKLHSGQIPETELLEGVMLLVGGALLLTPGFVTDAFGFICLLPGPRRPLARWIIAQTPFGSIRVVRPGGARRNDGSEHRNPTIEGEFNREDDH